MREIRILSSDDVATLATPEAFVDAVRDAYAQRGRGAPAEPRTTLSNAEPAGMLTTYAAILPETGTMGGYMYSAGFGAGDAWFVTPLFDATSGSLLALIDGASMNPYKTGAAGGVAVDALARADASEVAVFGSGAQARGQLKSTAAVRNLERVRVYSPTGAHREAYASEMDDYLDASVVAVDEPGAAVERADIVITATNASEPVFDGEELPDGAHVTAMGQYHPEKREVDATTVERSIYVPDLRARVAQDAGAFIQARQAARVTDAHIHAELGDVVDGDAEGRSGNDDITLFDSGGTGIETVAGATLLYERAKEEGMGQTVSFQAASDALTGRQV